MGLMPAITASAIVRDSDQLPDAQWLFDVLSSVCESPVPVGFEVLLRDTPCYRNVSSLAMGFNELIDDLLSRSYAHVHLQNADSDYDVGVTMQWDVVLWLHLSITYSHSDPEKRVLTPDRLDPRFVSLFCFDGGIIDPTAAVIRSLARRTGVEPPIESPPLDEMIQRSDRVYRETRAIMQGLSGAESFRGSMREVRKQSRAAVKAWRRVCKHQQQTA